MPRPRSEELSRRERQVMDIVYELGQATAADVQARLPDDITDPAVRSVLRILESKGHLGHRSDGPRYVYSPTVPRQSARRSALERVLHTFFGGSARSAMAALLELDDTDLSPAEAERLQRIVDRMRDEDRAEARETEPRAAADGGRESDDAATERAADAADDDDTTADDTTDNDQEARP